MTEQLPQSTAFSPIGVCVLPLPEPNAPRVTSYPDYIHEVLAHAGLYYDAVESAALQECLPQLRILITIGEAVLPEELQNALREWVRAGGAWLAVGGVAGLPEMFGVEYRRSEYQGIVWGGLSPLLGEGYLRPLELTHPVLASIPIPLHFFNGIAATQAAAAKAGDSSAPDEAPGRPLATTLDAHGRPGANVAIAERAVGRGHCLLIAPDVTGSIVRIQQGIAVTRDGLSAPDGTATVTDGLCKCDDGAVLDWHFDRQDAPGLAGLKCFLEPIADHWRALVLRAIFYLASEQQVPLVLLWLYPRNLPALAHMSHDSDGNDPQMAEALLAVTSQAEVATTWCVLPPGYEAPVIERIKDAGHELATHYDALDRPWDEAEFDAQWRALCRQFAECPGTNKNHYTRWEGDTEFFEWCARRGIEMDQSKGPSKFGEAGFLFGSCHPYFPVAPAGKLIDVLELPFLVQDLEIFIPATIVPALIRSVLDVHGVLHLLFHPHHIQKPGVAQSLLEAVAAAREAGLEWWTARRLNDWERARRQVQWTVHDNGDLLLLSPHPIQDATLLVLNSASQIIINGEEVEVTATQRWGFDFAAVTFDLEAETEYALQAGSTPLSDR